MRLGYETVVERLDLLDKLRSFDPVVIGTPPLGLALNNSDIDIACSSPDLNRFKVLVKLEFAVFPNFQIREATLQEENSVITQFTAFDWDIELFCQPIPTNQQWGVRHFHVEKRLLKLHPELGPIVFKLKSSGLKTEPAFAHAIGLRGDPYKAILDLEKMDDDELKILVQARS